MTTRNLVREPLRARPFVTEPPRSLPEVQALLQYEETLLQEVHHRVGNSLQIIASILALDARKVKSEEARLHLVKAHRRILAVATVQQQLQTSREGGDLELAAYLRQLGENLNASVVGDATRIAIDVRAAAGTVSSAVAMKMGLIVTELVINAVKHAFMGETAIRLFQRGNAPAENSEQAMDATADFSWRSLAAHLADPEAVAPPVPSKIRQYALGNVDGVRLTFSDAEHLGNGRVLYSAPPRMAGPARSRALFSG